MSAIRERLEWAGVVAAVWILSHLPFRTLRPLAAVCGTVGFYLDHRSRRVAMENIEAAFPGKYSHARKSQIARRSFATFARTMFELCWAPNIDEGFFDRHVIFEGWDKDYVRTNPDKPGIYACLHYGNFEWLSLAGALTISPSPIIAQRFKNPLLGPIFDRLRASTGSHIIPQERALIRLIKHLKSGGKCGMVCDLNLDPREGSVLVECFGGLLASVTQSHAALAQRTGAAIVPVECRPGPHGKYRIIHHPPIECPPDADPRELVQQCWNALEPAIHEHPESWLWPYKHWRYKPWIHSERYPSYSNHSKRFDKLVERWHKELDPAAGQPE